MRSLLHDEEVAQLMDSFDADTLAGILGEHVRGMTTLERRRQLARYVLYDMTDPAE